VQVAATLISLAIAKAEKKKRDTSAVEWWSD
jgi:hypothetical protein